MTTDPRTRAFEALANLLVTEESLADGLGAMLRIVVAAVPAASHAGLTTAGADGRTSTPVFTDPRVPDMDQAQYDSGRGPCLDCWRTGRPVRLPDLTDPSSPYPEFAAAALANGVRSTFSLPLTVNDRCLGALNLYGPTIEGFTDDDEELAGALAPATAAFVANAQAYWHAFSTTEQLNEALTSRSVIDMAKGILMASDPQLDADGAFELLRQASRRENVKLREIARRITERQASPEV